MGTRTAKWLAGIISIGLLAYGPNLYISDRGRLTTRPQTTQLIRSVTNNTLSSPSDPAIEITFSNAYKYLGGQHFVLYGVADVEQHFFVETHRDGTLKSFFWIQFEQYLPDNAYKYDYSSSPLHRQIDGFDFFVDILAGKPHPVFRNGRPGTDGYLARRFVARAGYPMVDHHTYARLAHLTDATSRKEMLIFFIEDLEPLGVTSTDLHEGGKHADRWPEIQAAHLERLESVMSLAGGG